LFQEDAVRKAVLLISLVHQVCKWLGGWVAGLNSYSRQDKQTSTLILEMSQKIGLKCANKMHKFVLDY
jgi:hypothetical protein